MKKYTAAVIGLGQIGMQYDYEGHDQQVLTHCCAFHEHPGYELIAGLDIDLEKRNQFEHKFHKPAFADLQSLFKDIKPDVISLCVPFEMQPEYVDNLLKIHVPKAVILEKPLSLHVENAKKMVAELEKNQVKCLVNYIRRFEPGVQRTLDIIKNGEIGNLQKMVAWYPKSMKSNGCHIIDLVDYLFKHTEGHCHFTDFSEDVKNHEIKVMCNHIPLHLFRNPTSYTRFELQFVGDQGMIEYRNSGREIILKKLHQDPIFEHLTFLGKEELIENDLCRYQWYVQDTLYQALNNSGDIPSTGQTALVTECFLEQISEQAIGV
jgi:predicted dehydrogenase